MLTIANNQLSQISSYYNERFIRNIHDLKSRLMPDQTAFGGNTSSMISYLMNMSSRYGIQSEIDTARFISLLIKLNGVIPNKNHINSVIADKRLSPSYRIALLYRHIRDEIRIQQIENVKNVSNHFLLDLWNASEGVFSDKNIADIISHCPIDKAAVHFDKSDAIELDVAKRAMPVKSNRAKLPQSKANDVADIINGMDEKYLKSLDLNARLSYLDDIRSDYSLNDRQYEAQLKIYKSISPDKNFIEWNNKKIDELIELIRCNTEIISAKDHWDRLSLEEKKMILFKISVIQGRLYGFSPVDINYVNQPSGIQKDKKDNKVNIVTRTGGFKVDDNGKKSIEVNTIPGSDIFNFEKAVNMITHESNHNFQYTLFIDYKNNKIDKNDVLYNEAKVMYYGMIEDKAYITSIESFYGYENQPIEKESFKIGNLIEAGMY